MSKTVQPTMKRHLRVLSAREGFRRGGFAFGLKAVDLEMSKLTAEQIRQIKAEPALVSMEVMLPVEAEPEAEPKE